MRAILQRVTSASCVVDGVEVSRIGAGVAVLLGVFSGDTEVDAAYVVHRLLGTRLWPGADGRPWGASAASQGLPLLVISQFTLAARTRKPKPDFARAAPPAAARELYERTLALLAAGHPQGAAGVCAGVFQAHMVMSLTNDGPVTVVVDSRNKDDVLPGGADAEGGEEAAWG